jgi:DNA-binding NtrC family response regulator
MFSQPERIGIDREMLMAQDSQNSSVHALELPPLNPATTPNEVVPFLIGSTVGEIERELVLQTLVRCGGNRTRAARVLGVSVRTLRNKIRQYSSDGIEVPAHS